MQSLTGAFCGAEDLTRALSTLGKSFTLSYRSPGVCFVLFKMGHGSLTRAGPKVQFPASAF